MSPAAKATVRSSTARTPWGTITREQIIEVATRAIRTAGGYEQMTIRSLAADLGVAPMSLYRHVRDKDDLLDEVVDRLLARAWKPRCDTSDWRAWVVEAADKLRRFLVTQPAGLHVYLTHPVVSPAAISRMQAMMGVLRLALGDEPAAKRAYAAIHTYTVGFAALEASRAGWNSPGSPEGQRTEPTVALAHQLAAYTTPQQFAQGLGYLLDGIERHSQKGLSILRPHHPGPTT